MLRLESQDPHFGKGVHGDDTLPTLPRDHQLQALPHLLNPIQNQVLPCWPEIRIDIIGFHTIAPIPVSENLWKLAVRY